jgi:hypothetical protein
MTEELPIEEHSIERRASGAKQYSALAGSSKVTVETDQKVLFLLAPGWPDGFGGEEAWDG